VVIDVAVDVLNRTRKAAIDEPIVRGQFARRVRRRLRPDHFGAAEPVGGKKRQHARTEQAVTVRQRVRDRNQAIQGVAAALADDNLDAGAAVFKIDWKLDLDRTDRRLAAGAASTWRRAPALQDPHRCPKFASLLADEMDAGGIDKVPGRERHA